MAQLQGYRKTFRKENFPYAYQQLPAECNNFPVSTRTATKNNELGVATGSCRIGGKIQNQVV